MLDPTAPRNVVASRAVATGLGLLYALSIPLVERDLRELASVVPALFSPLDWCVPLYRLQPVEVAQTLAWPLILAVLCYTSRVLVLRKLALLHSMPAGDVIEEESGSRLLADNSLGRELSQPFPRAVWSFLTFAPTVVISLHVAAGVADMILLHERPPYMDGFWPSEWAGGTTVVMLASGAIGIFFAQRLWEPMNSLRDALVGIRSRSDKAAGAAST